MTDVKLEDILNKIKDTKLRELLYTYRIITSPGILLEILDHLNVKFVTDALSAIIPQFDFGDRIHLGAIVLHGKLFRIELRTYDDGDILIYMYKHDSIILYHEKGQKP
jgi:hypothetical protein